MGLWNWIRTQALGVDLNAEQERSDDLDRQIRIENQKDYGPGGSIYNQTVQDKGVDAANAQYDQITAREDASQIDVEGQVGDAFNQGLREGAASIRGAIAAPFKLSWDIIPWQLLVAGLVFVFFNVGGGPWLLRTLKRVFK